MRTRIRGCRHQGQQQRSLPATNQRRRDADSARFLPTSDATGCPCGCHSCTRPTHLLAAARPLSSVAVCTGTCKSVGNHNGSYHWQHSSHLVHFADLAAWPEHGSCRGYKLLRSSFENRVHWPPLWRFLFRKRGFLFPRRKKRWGVTFFGAKKEPGHAKKEPRQVNPRRIRPPGAAHGIAAAGWRRAPPRPTQRHKVQIAKNSCFSTWPARGIHGERGVRG